jgi:hypothetical protein
MIITDIGLLGLIVLVVAVVLFIVGTLAGRRRRNR